MIVPITGWIVTVQRAAELVAEVEGCADWVDRERRYLTETASISQAFDRRICASDQRYLRVQLDTLKQQVKAQDSVWRSRELWFGLGAVAGTIAIILGAWAISLVAE